MISLNTLNIFFISVTSRDTFKGLKVFFFPFLRKSLFWLTISESTVHHHEEGMVAEGLSLCQQEVEEWPVYALADQSAKNSAGTRSR